MILVVGLEVSVSFLKEMDEDGHEFTYISLVEAPAFSRAD
jgi:hypothetical protein